MSVGAPDLTPDFAPLRCHLSSQERGSLTGWVGDLLLAKPSGEHPDCTFGRLLLEVHPPAAAGGQRRITIKQAGEQVLLSLRLLAEVTCPDSVLPWLTLHRACLCGPASGCPHFTGAQLVIDADNHKLVYTLAHDVPVNPGGRVVSDVIAARWLD